MKVGIVGCGAIGSFLAEELKDTVLFDRNRDRARELADRTGSSAVTSLEELVDRSDLVVEAAAPVAVPDVARAALGAGRNLMVMSVSALLDDDLRDEVVTLAEDGGGQIHTPSGAICGLDGVKAAATRDVESAVLTTRKPPEALAGAPGVEGIDLDGLTGEETVFEGPAREAVKLFPRNVNVSASLSLAGIGPDRTRVRIVADSSLDRNVHEVRVRGDFGELVTRVENVPSPDNPKTSYLAPMSALATIRGIEIGLKVGT